MRARLLLLHFLALTLAAQAQNDVPGDHARVMVHTHAIPGGLHHLASLGLAVDHGDVKEGRYVITDLSRAEIAKLDTHGHPYDILIEDVAAFYVARNAEPSPQPRSQRSSCGEGPSYPVPSNFQLGSMGGYYTWDEMLAEMDAMRAQYPGLISAKESIGTSLEGRPIHFMRMSNAPDVEQGKPEVFYNALHHAREPASLSQLIYFMWYLLENYGSDPEVTYLLDEMELYFVPCINPDGYVYNELIAPNGGGMWRKNRRDNGDGTIGVDLNRNYGFGWGVDNVGSSPDGDSQVYRGSAPFSEPETQVIRDFCLGRQFRLTLNNHTFGNLLIYPWGYLPSYYTPDSAVFVHFGQLLTKDNNYQYGTADQTVNYVVNGSSDDWMYGEQDDKPKIFAMTPEAGGALDGFWPAISRIEDICGTTMPQNLYLAHLAGRYARATDLSPAIIQEENAMVVFDLKRLGLEDGDFTVSLEPLENVLSTGDALIFAGMALLESRTDSLEMTLAPGLAPGSTVRFVLAVDNGAYSYRDTLTKVFGVPLVVLADDGGNLDAWETSSWGLSTFTWFSPPASITDSPFGDYTNNAFTQITLVDTLDLTNAVWAQLSFMARWDIEAGYDFVQVLASTDGLDWTPLCGLYTKPGSIYQDLDAPVYDGRQLFWVKEEMDLSAFLGESIRLRFQLVSDNWVTGDGFYFDDLLLTLVTDGSTGLAAAPGMPPQLVVAPNPATDYTWVTWNGDGAGPGRLLVHDALGQLVKELPVSGRQGSIRVDTSDLPPGTYLLGGEEAGKRAAAQRLVVMRP